LKPMDTIPRTPPILLITHTDRDGLLSGAALLRALGGTPAPDIILTQGSYLAEELDDLISSGRRYQAICVTDTYWHPQAAGRLHTGLRELLNPGGKVAWIDHHPSSVDHEDALRSALPLSSRSRFIGDRDGRFEAVSLVAESFGLVQDPVAADLVKAVRNGWSRNREPVPSGVQRWMEVVDGLARAPELHADEAAGIIRALSGGFDTPIPDCLESLAETTRRVRTRTAELIQRNDWPRLPSTEGGWGLLLDLHREPGVNAYELAVGLACAAGGRVDYFVTQEHPERVHYVSGPKARAARDAAERGGMPPLRVSTLHKGGRRSPSWPASRGIDLACLTRRQPAADLLGPWIDAHPYIVKAPWRRNGEADGAAVRTAASAIGDELGGLLERFGWSDRDRRPRG
jgi:hypothetical protein